MVRRHAVNWKCGVFVKMGAIRAIRGCPTRTIPSPDEGRMSGRPRCPPSSSFELRHSFELGYFELRAFPLRPFLLTTNHTNRTNAEGNWRRGYSCLFVPFVVTKKEPSPTLPPRAPRTAAILAPDCATRVGRLRRPTLRYVTQPLRGTNAASSFGHSSFPVHQGRPPAASNPSLCDATASRYQSCSAELRASASSFLRAWVFRASSFPPAVVAKKYLPQRRHHEPQPPRGTNPALSVVIYSGKAG